MRNGLQDWRRSHVHSIRSDVMQTVDALIILVHPSIKDKCGDVISYRMATMLTILPPCRGALQPHIQ